jgi:hypothetical protein
MNGRQLKSYLGRNFSSGLEELGFCFSQNTGLYDKKIYRTTLSISINCRIKWGYPVFDPLASLDSDWLQSFAKEFAPVRSETGKVITPRLSSLAGAVSIWPLADHGLIPTIDQKSADLAVLVYLNVIRDRLEPDINLIQNEENLLDFLQRKGAFELYKSWNIPYLQEKIEFLKNKTMLG